MTDFDLTPDKLIRLLSNATPFAFTRWGDGEVECVLGVNGPNCDGHNRDSRLRQDLTDVLEAQNKRQTMYMGLQPIADGTFPFFKDRYPHIQWCNADIIHTMSENGDWWRIVNEVKANSAALFSHHPPTVTPHYPKHYELPLRHWRKLPETNCYYDVSVDELVPSLERTNLFCASMASNVWIARLFQMHPTKQFIDLGSAYDPYCGIISRKYHHRIADRHQVPAHERVYAGSVKNAIDMKNGTV